MEPKRAIQLSNTLLAKLRKFPTYRGWSKVDFIRCQCRHEKIKTPTKHDHILKFEILGRFAERCGLVVPDKTMKEMKAVGKGLRPKRTNKQYKDSEVFTEWRLARYEALRLSSGKCECCGNTAKSSGEPLHVDHIKPKSVYPELEYEISNLQVLCADCNIGKGNWDETDWRDGATNKKATLQ